MEVRNTPLLRMTLLVHFECITFSLSWCVVGTAIHNICLSSSVMNVVALQTETSMPNTLYICAPYKSDCKSKMHSGSIRMVALTNFCRDHFRKVLIHFAKCNCMRTLDGISGQKTGKTSTPIIFFLWSLHNRRTNNFLFYNPTVKERRLDG